MYKNFVVILYLLSHGRPLTNFEKMNFFLELLKVIHCPKKHWCDNVGWGMAKALHTIIIQAMKFVLDLICLLCFVMKLLQLTNNFGFQSIHVPFKLDKGPYVIVFRTCN